MAAPGAAATLADRIAIRLGGRTADWVADGIVPWGGADAHLGDYSRVLMQYRPPAGCDRPGIAEMVSDMVATPAHELLADDVFAIEGRGNDSAGVVSEVLRLVMANARRNWSTFRGPRRAARLVALAPYLALRELLGHRRRQVQLAQLLDRVLDHLGALREDAVGQPLAEDASEAIDRGARPWVEPVISAPPSGGGRRAY